MIEVTVRTLNSQNHPFNVEDDITVADFKRHIAETVNIPADTQRIIYCGRVLQDEAKLNEFDVNGKVVHLVERPPPQENQRENGTRAHSPTPHNHQQRVLGGNAMYLGSMAIPLEPQNLGLPPPLHSFAPSRLNVARRMLRRAENVINQLDGILSGRPAETLTEEAQEEATPVFEARVIVPTTSTEPIDENFVLNAVQNSLINATEPPGATIEQLQQSEASTAASNATAGAPVTVETESASATEWGGDGTSPMSNLIEDLIAEGGRTGSAGNEANGLDADNGSRPSEMADLLDMLNRLQARFAPYLERYHIFMRDDPAVFPRRDIGPTQRMITLVSEVLHYLGHAYHSLSDVTVRVRCRPPRHLFCQPIVIHSAVLQAGFPIQVEAQINFAPENTASPSTQTPPSANAVPPTTAADTNTPAAAPQQPQPQPQRRPGGPPNFTVNPNMLSFPLMSQGGVHVQSFPIGIRTMRPSSGNRQPGAGGQQQQAQAQAQSQGNNTGNSGGNANAASNSALNNNANLEFFMEVTPGGITIDSLETTLLGGGQGAPPSELIQSIVQMANHFVNRTVQPGAGPPPATTQSAESTTQPQTSSTTSTTNSGQNSQARGNTQTHPTTATHTRSTARPHVHLAQHAMQGFDPFLPCNSHHLRDRRPRQPRAASTTNNNQQPQNRQQQQGSQQANNGTNVAGAQGGQFNSVYNIMQGLINSLQRRTTVPREAQPPTNPEATTGNRGAGNLRENWLNQLFDSPQFANIWNAQNSGGTDGGTDRSPTITQLMQQAGEQLDGEGIIYDLIMLISRNLTINDMLQLNAGRLDPLMRIRNNIRTFITDRILEGYPTPENLERGVERLITEMQPFIENLGQLRVRNDIDIVRSTQVLFRTLLPDILSLAVFRTPNSLRMLVDQLQTMARHFYALIVHASINGQRGAEEVISNIASRYMEGIAPNDQLGTLLTTRVCLQLFMLTVNVPATSLQQYIVRNIDSVTTTTPPPQVLMELDGDNETGNVQTANDMRPGSSTLLDMSSDELAVAIGSEPWQGQVPSDWVPIIARDSQRQRRQSRQSPLSDAYLSGMSSKRRKIVTTNKPQGSLPQVISESIRRAVTATGISQTANLENVAAEAGSDPNIQSAYRDLLRSRVQSSIQGNDDFTPDRFPNASNYFNKSQ